MKLHENKTVLCGSSPVISDGKWSRTYFS